jgi:hypothetical protein
VWNDSVHVLEKGMLLYSLDDGAFKITDGASLVVELPVEFTYDELLAAQSSSILDQFVVPDASNHGEIVNVGMVEGVLMYQPSGTTLAELHDQITALGNDISTLETNMTDITALVDMVDASIGTGPDGNLVIVSGGKYVDSGMSLADIITAAESQLPNNDGHLEDVIFYRDMNMTILADMNEIYTDTIYYCRVPGYHDGTSDPIYGLTTTNVNVSIAHVGDNVFTVDVGTTTSITFTASISDGSDMYEKVFTRSVIIEVQDILVSIYGGSSTDWFRGVITNANDDIICAGYTRSEGSGNGDALVVKFSGSDLSILARKVYGGTGDDYFYGVATDTNNNIICVGYTTSEGSGYDDALVVKFSGSDLSILAKKVYGGTSDDVFWGVATDTNNAIICAGITGSEGSGYDDALVVKFSGSDLSILAKKVYGGTSHDFFYGVATDTNNAIICAGITGSEGSGNNDALVVKFSGSDLSILARKVYGGTSPEYFYGVATDTNNDIICAGNTYSEGSGNGDALVVKFSGSDLSILAKKVYGGTDHECFYGVATDTNNDIICAGYTYSEGGDNNDTLVVKFSGSDLSILAKKAYGGTSLDIFYVVATDTNNDIICAGYTGSEGSGGNDALVVKLPSDIPTGTFVGTVLTNLILADSNLTLVDSNLTLADSNLTLADSNLTLADSNLTLADSNLTQESDTIVL